MYELGNELCNTVISHVRATYNLQKLQSLKERSLDIAAIKLFWGTNLTVIYNFTGYLRLWSVYINEI